MTKMTSPHTYESGITILGKTKKGALIVTDGLMVAFIIENYIRPDGTLTPRGQKMLLNSDWTFEKYNEDNRAWREKIEREKREREEAWKRQREENAKLITCAIEPGILLSASATAYKYICGRGVDRYHRVCNHYNYIPKSQVSIERRNNKVYVTLPTWLAKKNSHIFNVAA